ncbi:aspartate kinase [Solibaculum mannosilyticum]
MANADRVRNVARIVTDTYRQGHDVIVVVSAQGDTTDDLIEKANEINPKASKREMDMLLAAGEEISISLLAMAIESLGFPVVSMLGWQAGFQTTSVNGNARIKRIDTDRLREALDKRNIVVVAGFQGINRFGDISTLGRGGSDTSAVALAAALQAECCQIYTDVDGVYTADPRKVKNARKLEEITYDEMLELATLGAQVLHNRSVEMAKKYNVDLEVRSSLDPVEGTKVKEVVNVEKMLIKGVTRDNNIARISIVGVKDQPGIAFKIFSRLAGAQVNVDIILQSIGRDGTKDIAFTVPQSQGEAAMNAIKDMAEIVGCKHVHYHDNVSKVSVVGAGMESNPGVAARMFEALYDADINIQMISTSEIKISVIINRDMADRAVAAIHDAFIS